MMAMTGQGKNLSVSHGLSDGDSGYSCTSSTDSPVETSVCGSRSSTDESRKRKGTEDKSTMNKIRKSTNKDSTIPVINDVVLNMMAKMGHKDGHGLGRHEQGLTVPVEASKQRGRTGFGGVIPDVDRNLFRYDPNMEHRETYEEVTWLESCGPIEWSFNGLLQKWPNVGQKKRVLDNETHFCDANTLKLVLKCKNALDTMTGEQMGKARGRANPFELIKKGPFMNRAAMKMANINSVFHNMFTHPRDEYKNSIVAVDELMYFADVCAGPGGFSEYVLSICRWRAKGFGLTLKKENDFQLADFFAGSPETFEPFYGKHGDGDIYKRQNIDSFICHVFENTAGRGVHVMMADGGFSVKGSENIQEILSKRLYLCQIAVALAIVRPGGNFVCKLFDVFTPFSVGLVYILYRCFKRITIHKPNTSRPANSERYIICQWKLENVRNVRDYLLNMNEKFDKYGETSEEEINEIVPLDVMKSDQKFYDYILCSNNSLAERQINSLAKILLYSENETLVDEKRPELKTFCMETWGVEMKARSGPSYTDPDALVRTLLRNDTTCLKKTPAGIENVSQVGKAMKSIHDWHAVILGSDSRNGTAATFFLGVGRKKCYKFDRATQKWALFFDPHWQLELSPNTLVFGEIVSEAIYEGQKQMKRNVLHIIDGHTLGGEYIGSLHYTKRVQLCSLYAHALNRPSMNTLMSIRMKSVYEMDQLEEKPFRAMKNVTMKNMAKELAFSLNSSGEQFYIPRGIMFVKATKSPYIRWISKQHNQKYYSFPNPQVPARFDRDRPQEASNNFNETYTQSTIWYPNKDIDQRQFNAETFIVDLFQYVRTNKHTKNCA